MTQGRSVDSADDIKVLMIPDYSENNPYQRELQAELEAEGATVIMTDSIGYFAVLGAVRKHGLPDVLHLHWLQSYAISKNIIKTTAGGLRLLCELFLLKSLGVTIVWTVHNVLDHREHTPRLEKLIKHIVVRLSDHIIVHCSAALMTIIQAYYLPRTVRQKCSIIPHGHYIDSYPNDLSQAEARAMIDIEFDNSKVVYLSFGQIRPYKNMPELIKNFKKLNESNIQLLIVGNPWDEEEAKMVQMLAQSDPRIRTIFEFIPDDEIQLYMNAADVVVLPFEKVLTSGSALLAMSFGRALIAPQIGCVEELLDSEGGFAYDPGRDGLVNAMKQALDADLNTMGEYNLQKAKSLDWKRIAQQTYTVYEKCDQLS